MRRAPSLNQGHPMETAQPMPQPPDHRDVPATRCPQCLRQTMVAAPGGGLRCTNVSCRREWPPRVFGCLVAVLVCFALVCMTGCAGIPEEQHQKLRDQFDAEQAAHAEERAAHDRATAAWAAQTAELKEVRRMLADFKRKLREYLEGR